MPFHLSSLLHSSARHSITFRCSDADLALVGCQWQRGEERGGTALMMSCCHASSVFLFRQTRSPCLFFSLPPLSYLPIWVSVSIPYPMFFYASQSFSRLFSLTYKYSVSHCGWWGFFQQTGSCIDIQIILLWEIKRPLSLILDVQTIIPILSLFLHAGNKPQTSFPVIQQLLCRFPWATHLIPRSNPQGPAVQD